MRTWRISCHHLQAWAGAYLGGRPPTAYYLAPSSSAAFLSCYEMWLCLLSYCVFILVTFIIFFIKHSVYCVYSVMLVRLTLVILKDTWVCAPHVSYPRCYLHSHPAPSAASVSSLAFTMSSLSWGDKKVPKCLSMRRRWHSGAPRCTIALHRSRHGIVS